MRTRTTMAAITGAGLLALVACGTGGNSTATSESGSGKASGTPVALPVESTARKATWTDESKAHQLTLAPQRLARGTAADLDHVRLDADLKGMVPYYLTVTYTNTASDAIARPDPEANFTVTLADGTPGTAIRLWDVNHYASAPSYSLPDNCEKAGPAVVPPAGTATVCQLVLLPEGHTPAHIAYSDDSGETLLWKVGDGTGDDGTLLAVGTTADSSYQGATTKSGTVPIRVTLKGVRAGSIRDLGNYELSNTQKNLVPWYVTFEYRNVGKEKLLPTMDDGVELRTVAGREVQPVSLFDFSPAAQGEGIDQCRGSVPNTRLEPKATLTLCTVHLLPEGDRPAMVSFQGEGKAAKTLMWRAG